MLVPFIQCNLGIRGFSVKVALEVGNIRIAEAKREFDRMVISISQKRDLLSFLLLQLASSLAALAAFRWIEERWLAALVAGSGFVIVGVWMVLKTLRWPNRFRMITFYTARAHLFLFSLPMLIVRIKYFGVDFKQLHFLWLSGPEFHRVSEVFFLIMILGTIADFLRLRLANKMTSQK